MSGIRKNRIAKSATAVIGAAALLTGTIPALADENAVYRTVEEIQESGSVRIGVFSDKSPFGYVDEYGEYQGYDVYFARRIGEDLGVYGVIPPLHSGRGWGWVSCPTCYTDSS